MFRKKKFATLLGKFATPWGEIFHLLWGNWPPSGKISPPSMGKFRHPKSAQISKIYISEKAPKNKDLFTN